MPRLAPSAAAVLAATFAWGLLSVFADRFVAGGTWSGLNQAGGGPGFLLLLVPGVAALLARPRWVRDLRPGLAFAEAAFVAALGGAVLAVLLRAFPPFDSIAPAPYVSGVAGAMLVPRVVASVLEHAWRQTPDGSGRSSRPEPDCPSS